MGPSYAAAVLVILLKIRCFTGEHLPALRQTHGGINCCGDLGCFDTDGAFEDILKRPINVLPSCETRLKLSLKTQDNVAKADILDPYNSASINASNFRADREGTKILIHGYLDTENVRWMSLMEPKLLLHGDFNVIRVDWSAGIEVNYFQAAANTRIVGAVVARLISTLHSKFGQDLSTVHIIGHSLGAHVAGYAGERMKIGRITGLDPAGLYFKDMPPSVRLDPSDADLVDTVVTDGRDLLQLGYGSMQPMGHYNFFPNGGQGQPGCGKSLWSSLMTLDISGTSSDALGCSHFRAPILYADTVANPTCTFTAVQCENYEAFRRGQCFSCDNDQCQVFGLDVDVPVSLANQQRSYYFVTGSSTPFCELLYRVTIRQAYKLQSTEKGIMKIQLHGKSKSSSWIEYGSGSSEIVPGSTSTYVVSVPQSFGPVEAVHLTWEYDYSLLHPFAWLSSHTLHLEPRLELTLLQHPPVAMTTDTTEIGEKMTAIFKLNR
ncbi:Inactive pancreatic lipase-related protein 1 [Hypsibius exemplaris]|uniref:Inactive pancreatic lipase-related protein 1 n=1 Tax=Hypsibius exemplaris TaxID=2072580 RepID=A0A1W0XEZ8_HYPEX|nr:Inactive pancreatic lipase-related protein 1 [Hypsibius exemplaris]